MGGSWSGRWGGHARRLTVEEAFLAFEVAACREVLTQPDGTRGEACWGDATRIGVRVGTLPNGYRTLRLAYAIQIDDAPQEEYGEELAVEPVRQPLGGRRWYFRCPRCDRRCACLYLVRRAFRFRCGRCHGLAYHGHRLDRVARHQRLFRQIVRHLGEDPDVDGWGHLPARPPGMRRRTYARWESRWERLCDAYERDFAIGFQRREAPNSPSGPLILFALLLIWLADAPPNRYTLSQSLDEPAPALHDDRRRG